MSTGKKIFLEKLREDNCKTHHSCHCEPVTDVTGSAIRSPCTTYRHDKRIERMPPGERIATTSLRTGLAMTNREAAAETACLDKSELSVLAQRPHGVQYCDHADAHVAEDRQPHAGKAQGAEDQDGELHRQSEDDILLHDPQGFPGNAHG